MLAIPNFPNYFITKDGKVWSNISNKFLKLGRHRQGYPQVELVNGTKSFLRRVHRLVLETYVGHVLRVWNVVIFLILGLITLMI